MYQTRHFVTGKFISHASFVDDNTYSTILDNVVKATCDIFLVHHQGERGDTPRVWLGKRVGLPHNDWWIPGGRMMPGERVCDAAQRILKREMNLDIDLNSNLSQNLTSRVRTVSHFTFVWDTRTQQPVENGTCDVSVILRIDVSDEEVKQIVHKQQEYEEVMWVSTDLRTSPTEPAKLLHPALLQGLADLRAMFEWDSLVKMVKGRGTDGGGDSSIVDQLQRFMVSKGEL